MAVSKPTDVLRWCDTPTTARTAPPSGLKDVGAAVQAKWPAQYLNYLHGLAGDWIKWIDDRIFDEYTVPTLGSDCLLYGDPGEGLEVRNTDGNRLPVRASELQLGAAGAVKFTEDSGTAACDGPVAAESFKLDADRSSTMLVPLCAAMTNEFGGVRWTKSCGSGPDADLLLSVASGAQAVWTVQIPYGAMVTGIVVDWQAAHAAPGTKMCLKAHKILTMLQADGAAPTVFTYDMLAAGKLDASASTDRKQGVYTPDQNNDNFVNDVSAITYVRIEIVASSEASNDKVYGLYLVCKHRSAGHLSVAPVAA